MFDLPEPSIHKIASKMMVNEQLQGAWDEPSGCIVMHAVEHTRLQKAALAYADKAALFVEQNERLMDPRSSYGREERTGGEEGGEGGREREPRQERGGGDGSTGDGTGTGGGTSAPSTGGHGGGHSHHNQHHTHGHAHTGGGGGTRTTRTRGRGTGRRAW